MTDIKHEWASVAASGPHPYVECLRCGIIWDYEDNLYFDLESGYLDEDGTALPLTDGDPGCIPDD